VKKKKKNCNQIHAPNIKLITTYRYGDLKKFPYIEAVILEIQRWSSIATIMDHGTPKGDDVELRGYKIPGNSIVYINIYAALRDPKKWERPSDFYPLHFYDPETKSLRNTQYNIIFNVGEC
jgi:cytochrome P450